MHPLLDCVKTKNNILSVGNDYLILCHKLYILMYQKMLKHIYPAIYPSKVTLSVAITSFKNNYGYAIILEMQNRKCGIKWILKN